MADRKVTDSTSHARVRFWHYRFQSFPLATNQRIGFPPSSVLGIEEGTIEAELVSINVSKSIRQPSGTFDITVLPTKNWRQVLAPGDWLVIYLFNGISDEFQYKNENVIMLGNIDRVARIKQKDEESDKTTVRYQISGRDFGKVFEDTDIFFDPYAGFLQSATLISQYLVQRGLAFAGTPTQLVNMFVDIFLSGDGGKVPDPILGKSSTSPLNQWLIPDELALFFAGGGNYFHDILQKQITEDLPGYKPRAMMTPGSNGGLWSHLKRNSNELVNHLYCDMQRDDPKGPAKPTIFLKPVPASPFYSPLQAPLLTSDYKSLSDKAAEEGVIEITSDDIMYENIGRDGNYRFNMIWVEPKLSDKSAAVETVSNLKNLPGVRLPMVNDESMQRYGLKRLAGQLDFIYQEASAETTLAIEQYKSFLAYIYDINAYHHCYETGTFETGGKVNAQLGRVLRVVRPQDAGGGGTVSSKFDFASALAAPPPKLYFIDGYKHTWKFPNIWRTEFSVTMGQWDSSNAPFIDLNEADNGAFDTEFDSTSLVKTNVPRPNNTVADAGGALGLIDSIKNLV